MDIRPSCLQYRPWCLLGLGLLMVQVAGAQALLRCAIEVNGEVQVHAFKPTSDPYRVESVAIGERFRFKAVVWTEADEVKLVSIAAHYQTRRQPMLMQQAKYIKPIPQTQPAPDALTGRVALYSPVLGKELAYQCALHRESP